MGIGVFKNVNNPKALWFGFKESENLKQLKFEIDKVMSFFGFSIEDRRFKPHVTIGRMKFVENKNTLTKLIDKYKEVEFENLEIHEIVLYESRLTSQGAIYKILKSISLI